MTAVATAIVGGAIIGGIATKKGADAQAEASAQASDAQLQATRENIEFQKEVFEQQREDQAPWRQAGIQALGKLERGVQDGTFDPSRFQFQKDPGYQFRLQEGINALDYSAAARGRLQSGAQARATTRYASGLASQEYQNAWNRNASSKSQNFNQLASLAGVGQTANQAVNQARSNMAANVGQATTQAGNAIAQNAMNQGAARSSAYQGYAQSANQGIQNYLMYSMYGG